MPLHGGDKPGATWTGERYQRGITSEFHHYASAMDVPETDGDVVRCNQHFSRQRGAGGGGNGEFLLPLQFVPFDDVAEFCQLLVLVIQQHRNQQQNKHDDNQVEHHKHTTATMSMSNASSSLQERKQLDHLFDDLP